MTPSTGEPIVTGSADTVADTVPPSVPPSAPPSARPGIGDRIGRRRWWVMAVGLLLLLLALPVAGSAETRMQAGSFAADEQAARADRLLSEEFAAGPPHMIVLATSGDGADSQAASADAAQLTDRLRGESGVARVDSYWSVGRPDVLRSSNGRTALILVRLDGDEAERLNIADRLMPLVSEATAGSLRLSVTGEATVGAALERQMQDDLVKAETITAPLALAILVLVFGSLVAAGLPLLVGVVTVVATLAALAGLTYLVDVSVFSLNLTTAIGIGLAIDYSLFIITRYREQVAAGDDTRRAVTVAVRTAGRTVWFSALTVSLGFAAPLVFPSMRSLAYAGIAVSLLAAITATVLLPAVLAILGHRVDALDPLRRWHARRPPTAIDRGFWHRLSGAVMRRPVVVLIGVVTLLVLLALPFQHANYGVQDDRVLPVGHPVQEAGSRLRSGFDVAESQPTTVVLPGFIATTAMAELDDYAARASELPDVERVDTASGSFRAGERVAPPGPTSVRYTGDGGTWLQVISEAEPFSARGTELVERLRGLSAPVPAVVGGPAAGLLDTRDEISSRLLLALLIIGVSTFVLLFLFTGSLLIPLKAIVLNLLSLTATFGAMVYVFQDGNLRWLVGDFTVTGYIDIGMPLLIFCVAFGLSMDYEVFLLSRITEEYAHTGDNMLAVRRGLQRTGRLVTAAAALVAVVLAAMATSGVSSLKLLGIGLALAVLLDATLVRALLVPAFMRLAGRANWWAPAPLRRLHRRWGLSEAPPGERPEVPA